MNATTENIWQLLDVSVEKLQEKDSNIELDSESKNEFDSIFKKNIKKIKKNYMKTKVKNLDRHKVAAIIIFSILKSKAVKYEGNVKKGEIFIGQYVIAASVGFTYMQSCLNTALEKKGQKPIEKYCFPTPMSCNREYFEVFCRNLYYADTGKEWGLNPLDIADRLFLLEYYTLIKNDIDPSILNEY